MELRQLFGVHTQSNKVPFNYEDMSDFSDADISTGLLVFQLFVYILNSFQRIEIFSLLLQ